MGKVLSEIKELENRKGTRCGWTKAEAQFKGEDKKDLDAALEDLAITSTAIAKWISKQGLSISAHVIQRHRRGECSCEK